VPHWAFTAAWCYARYRTEVEPKSSGKSPYRDKGEGDLRQTENKKKREEKNIKLGQTLEQAQSHQELEGAGWLSEATEVMDK
jgi:hypothetical protein